MDYRTSLRLEDLVSKISLGPGHGQSSDGHPLRNTGAVDYGYLFGRYTGNPTVVILIVINS